jgi:hypothetical protein
MTMSLTSPPLGDSCKIHDPEWIAKAAAALHYLETHGNNIKDAMEAMVVVATTKPSMEPDVDEGGYWKHELKALQEVFVQAGLPESGIKPPRAPTEVKVLKDPIPPSIQTPEFFQLWIKELRERMVGVTPESNLTDHHGLVCHHRIVMDVFSSVNPRPCDFGTGMDAEAQAKVDAEKRAWWETGLELCQLSQELYYRMSVAIATKICGGHKLP